MAANTRLGSARVIPIAKSSGNGNCLDSAKLLAEGEKHLLAGYRGLKETEATIPEGGKVNIINARERLAGLYTMWGTPREAAKWKADEEGETRK